MVTYSTVAAKWGNKRPRIDFLQKSPRLHTIPVYSLSLLRFDREACIPCLIAAACDASTYIHEHPFFSFQQKVKEVDVMKNLIESEVGWRERLMFGYREIWFHEKSLQVMKKFAPDLPT